MSNLQKRILTSIIVLPLSIFFIFKGEELLLSFLFIIFFIANHELFSVFRKKKIIIFLDLILILSLFSIYYLRDNNHISFQLLLWFIILTICSDVGGYVFGKLLKWKKLTSISPKKTFSGVLGSFILSLFSLFIMIKLSNILFELNLIQVLMLDFSKPKFFFVAIILSLIAQSGDLTISYFKRLEKVKDTGKILPGHGGIFDRIDSLMFVVIFGFLLYNFNIIP
tara:strand:+ start:2535 stop:3206 length:672 start_codon:yes stop_codon:yes gene_type:complete